MPTAYLFATGLQGLDYVIVLLYMAALLGIGFYLARRQTSTEEFFVGGRSMPWWAVGLSMIATMMSTISYLGTPGEIIKHGVAQATALIGMPISLAIVGFLWVPFFMRLRLTSAYEYLERRFGFGTRMLAVSLYLYMRFIWMGLIIFTASRAIAAMTEESAIAVLSSSTGSLIQLSSTQWFYAVLIFTGLISTTYTTLGGIKAVIWTDVIQFLVLFGGAIATLLVVWIETRTGPTTWWREVTSVAHPFPPPSSWNLAERNTVLFAVLGGVVWNACTHSSDQVALQRYFTTPSASSARKVAVVNYLCDALMMCLLALVGMALLSYYSRHPGQLPPQAGQPGSPAFDRFADQVFPRFIAYGLPVGLSGIVLAGVCAVAQSSLDSGINSTTTVILVDLIGRLRRHKQEPAAELRLAKRLTLTIGIAITVTGFGISFLPKDYNIVDLTLKLQNVVLGPMGAVFMAGILLPHVGGRAALTAGILGTVCAFLFAFGDQLAGITVPSAYLVNPLSWLVTFLAAALLGGVLRAPSAAQVRGLTRQSALRGETPEPTSSTD